MFGDKKVYNLKVSKRGGFSDRNSIKPENKEIQMIEFDKRTRIQFANMFSKLYSQIYSGRYSEEKNNFLGFVIGEVYSQRVDARLMQNEEKILNLINYTLENDEYDDVLTLLEAIFQYWNEIQHQTIIPYSCFSRAEWICSSVFDIANDCFQQEYVGYRFIDGNITPISDEYEVEAISDSLDIEYNSVKEHISKASKYLSDREKPDYENSIKESISAVEAMCEIITGARGNDATLSRMLEKLESNGVVIHESLKKSIKELYWYTCDANGIRHAGDIGGPNSTFEEAKFMLVSCSAFVNYLIGIYKP